MNATSAKEGRLTYLDPTCQSSVAGILIRTTLLFIGRLLKRDANEFHQRIDLSNLSLSRLFSYWAIYLNQIADYTDRETDGAEDKW